VVVSPAVVVRRTTDGGDGLSVYLFVLVCVI
jgi:hypothetical protein